MSRHAMNRPRRRYAAILLGVLGLGILPAWLTAANLPPVKATAATDIVIDGKLDELGWRDGPWFADFEEAGTGNTPSVETRAAIRFDDTNLYDGVICHEPQIDKLIMAATERDKRVWGDDCVELFLDVTGKRTDYVHFIVNAKGTVYDARRSGDGENWVTVCNDTNRPGRPLNAAFPPQETDAVRFVFDGPGKGCRATEIALYGE